MGIIYSLNNITKQYSGTTALNNVDFELADGEIHSLVGKNGAGKSTLVGIMYGSIAPTSGTINLFGKDISHLTPMKAVSMGLFLVPQHPEFALDLTVSENMFLGHFLLKKDGALDRKLMDEHTNEIITRMKLKVNSRELMRRVDVESQQLLLAGKAFWIENAKIILLDEITATLSLKAKNTFYEILSEVVKKEKKSIVYITHRMQEVIQLSDRVTVLRNGIKIGTRDVKALSPIELTSMITGNEDISNKINVENDISKDNEPVISLRDFSSRNTFHNISLDVYKGEVVGIAGLEGSGASELMRAVFGIGKFYEGSMKFNGKEVVVHSPRKAMNLGIAYLTRDRESEGIIQGCTIEHNIMGSQYSKVTNKFGIINTGKANDLVGYMHNLLNIKMTTSKLPIDSLSGGNKQKVLFARMINNKPKLFMLDHATQGIDVEAIQEILRITREILSKESAIIMSSESIEDMMSICDRIIVMFVGEIVAEFARDDFQEERIFLKMQGFKEEKNEN
ncbi:MAG: sugar ABC transporter ATP-binding protein [Eubacteriales bacterium]|nr:sugar ABC transporter ATP-binding protein [Eubacteriales bacterium]